jgi:hypothetical protein
MITSNPVFQSTRVRTWACLVGILALNVYVCHNLFRTEFTQETVSVDLAFMAFSRWLADHWNDSSWFPMWMMGTPARQVYNPLLHHTVAFLSRMAGWTAPHAYHFVTAATYSLGPVTLFLFCYRLTLRHGYALLTALIYSLISPSAFLATRFLIDNGRLFNPRRFQTLVHYGEGPHVTALMLIPLALWMLHCAAVDRRWIYIPLASVAVAAIPLTNWTGTTGFTMALIAYVVSRFSAASFGERPLHWPTLIAIGVLAYTLAMPWIPPSLILSVQASAATLETVSSTSQKASMVFIAALLLLGLYLVFQRYRTPGIHRFFFNFAAISGVVVLGRMWFGLVLVPIASRFHLEMEMAIAGAGAFVALAVVARLPRRLQYLLLGLSLVAGFEQTRIYRREARKTTTETDVTNISENKMSNWFAANAKGQRVFAPGSVALWLNQRADTPQFYGCCDQTVRVDAIRMASYQIYGGEGAGEHEGQVASLWLQIFGVRYVAVSSLSAEVFPPYRNSKKFDGVLDEVWRDGDNVIYRVPGTGSLAHVVPASLLQRPLPWNGADPEQLKPFAEAFGNPDPSDFRWINQHEAEIGARTAAGQVVLIQETCDPGWHASEGSSQLPTSCGPFGFIVVDPRGAGTHTIRLTYSQSQEDRIARGAQLAGIVVLLVWTLRARRRATS